MIRFTSVLIIATIGVCSASEPIYTEADVKAFVRPGIARADLIQRFGQPSNDDKPPSPEQGDTSIDEIMIFHLPFEVHARTPTKDWVFAGFIVRLKNQKVVSWDIIHSTTE